MVVEAKRLGQRHGPVETRRLPQRDRSRPAEDIHLRRIPPRPRIEPYAEQLKFDALSYNALRRLLQERPEGEILTSIFDESGRLGSRPATALPAPPTDPTPITGDYTATPADNWLLVDTTIKDITVTIYDPTAIPAVGEDPLEAGSFLRIKNVGEPGHFLNVVVGGGGTIFACERIDEACLSPGDSLTLMHDLVEWFVV